MSTTEKHLGKLIGNTGNPAGLSLALSSPNVQYADLDGNLDLINDPSTAGFVLEDGWLIATDLPGLGSAVQVG